MERPRAWHRDLAEAILSLPEGSHTIIVEPDDFRAPIKPEGGCMLRHGGKRITIVPKIERSL